VAPPWSTPPLSYFRAKALAGRYLRQVHYQRAARRRSQKALPKAPLGNPGEAGGESDERGKWAAAEQVEDSRGCGIGSRRCLRQRQCKKDFRKAEEA